MSRHTRGPWVVRTVDESIGTVETADGKTIVGHVFDLGLADRLNGHSERKANAALFAAAPELLEALVAMDESMCRGFETREDRDFGRRALIAARAAILKAAGVSHADQA